MRVGNDQIDGPASGKGKRGTKGCLIVLTVVLFFIFLLVILPGRSAEKAFQETMARADELIKLGNYEEAIPLLKKALEIRSDEDVSRELSRLETIVQSREWFERGATALSDGNYRAAIDFFAKIPTAAPDYAAAQEKIKEAERALAEESLAYARAAITEKDYKRADRLLNQALRHDPELAEAAKLKEQIQPALEALRKKKEVERLAAERARAIERMETYETGLGPVAVAVRVETADTFSDGYSIWFSKDGTSWFVKVAVYVKNTGSLSIHVNPNYITLATPDGFTTNPHEVT